MKWITFPVLGDEELLGRLKARLIELGWTGGVLTHARIFQSALRSGISIAREGDHANSAMVSACEALDRGEVLPEREMGDFGLLFDTDAYRYPIDRDALKLLQAAKPSQKRHLRCVPLF